MLIHRSEQLGSSYDLLELKESRPGDEAARKMSRWRKGRATQLGDLKNSGTVRHRLGSRSGSPRSELLRATFAVRKGHRKKKIRRSYSEQKWVSGRKERENGKGERKVRIKICFCKNLMCLFLKYLRIK